MKRYLFAFLLLAVMLPGVAQEVDYSVTKVDQESGMEITRISKETDYVCLPMVKRSRDGVQWLTNRILAISPDGNEIAFLSLRNNTTNIFIKDIDKQGASRQRTNRSAVIDFSYSPDGSKICFTETTGDSNPMFLTDARNGYICRQLTSGTQDYSPIYGKDGSKIFFVRIGARGPEIWSNDMSQNFLSSYTTGMNPYPSPEADVLYMARMNDAGRGEIWRVYLDSGVEECIMSDPERSFFSPMLSPDGNKLLFVGSTKLQEATVTEWSTKTITYWNTDIYTCNTDGTDLVQLTFHAADDLSPVWSNDGQYVYFISQRGSADGTANIWRLKVN